MAAAVKLDLWKRDHGTAYVREIPKRSSGHRQICAYNFKSRARQIAGQDLLQCHASRFVDPRQKVLNGGRNAAIDAILTAMNDGYREIVCADIRDCFGSIRIADAATIVPVDTRLVRNNIAPKCLQHLTLGTNPPPPHGDNQGFELLPREIECRSRAIDRTAHMATEKQGHSGTGHCPLPAREQNLAKDNQTKTVHGRFHLRKRTRKYFVSPTHCGETNSYRTRCKSAASRLQQGSAFSPIVVEMVLASVVRSTRLHTRIVSFADNFWLLAKTKREASLELQNLHAALAQHPAGRLQLGQQQIVHARYGFEALGYLIRSPRPDRKIIIQPSEANFDRFERRHQNYLNNVFLRGGRRCLKRAVRHLRSWLVAFPHWEGRHEFGLRAARDIVETWEAHRVCAKLNQGPRCNS